MGIIHCNGVCLVTEESSDEYVVLGRRTIGLTYTYSKAYIFGRTVNLSLYECKVLELLMLNSGAYITRDKILDYLGDMCDISDRTVDTIIKRLRKKLFPDNKKARHLFIQTRYGMGYRIPKRDT